MKNPFARKNFRISKATRLLAIDAWIDSTLYEAGFKAREQWENITIFFRRFRVSGIRRAVVEVTSEAFTLSTAASVVLLALALPAFDETSRDWRSQDDFAVTFLDRYGNEIGQRGIIQRDSIPVDEMPDHVIKSVLATEDRRFFEHFGIDLVGLGRAMSQNMRANSVVQGGSTITQQLAKNLFLSNERTIERKIKEAYLALWLEMNLSKEEILQLYLDRAYLGGGTFGIAAAADFYFGKNVKDVTLAEAAMLAGLFKAPSKYAPHVNLPAARARANTVLNSLVDSGLMAEGQVVAARHYPADVVDRGNGQSPDYFLDWAFEEVQRIARTSGHRSMIARTTIDMTMQRAAEESLEFHLRQHGKSYRTTQGAIVLLETNGAVRALVGGRDYGVSQYNRATRARRQAGSSFKPYVYAAAMENGFTPSSIVPDAPISWGNWSPQNYSRRFSGRVNLTTALVRSINTVPVRLARDHLTTAPIKALAEAMGVESELITHKTMVLGTSEMTVMDQATGYNTFANGGFSNARHAITQLMTHSGEVFYEHERNGPKPRRVLSEQAVSAMNSILVQIPEWGTGRRAALPGVRSGGKTGTTQGYRDAWYVGFTGNFTAAVWLGNDDFTPTNKVTGGLLPAMTWQRLMAYVHQNLILKPIPGIDDPFPAVPDSQRDEDAGNDAIAGIERPPVLSQTSRKLLLDLADQLKAAPVLALPLPDALPDEAETLSSLGG